MAQSIFRSERQFRNENLGGTAMRKVITTARQTGIQRAYRTLPTTAEPESLPAVRQPSRKLVAAKNVVDVSPR